MSNASGDRPIALLAPTEAAGNTARRIAATLPHAEVHGLAGRVSDADLAVETFTDHIRDLFLARRPIIGICASGILIRALAPVLTSKHEEPPVIAVSEDGQSIVPLLGGHHGANQLAVKIAQALDGHAALTTAGEVRHGIALDDPPPGWVLVNPETAKSAMAAILAGAPVTVDPALTWLQPLAKDTGEGEEWALVTGALTFGRHDADAAPNHLIFEAQTLVLGVGASRGCPPEELWGSVERALAGQNLSAHAIACIATIDVKVDERAIIDLAARLDRPLRLFTAADLNAQTHRVANPSNVVFTEVGTHSVAEASALAMAGDDATLIQEKQKTEHATVAIAQAAIPVDPASVGRARGRVSIVGIGPGQASWRVPEASRHIAEAEELVGYGLYIDLLGPAARGKTRTDFPLGGEEARCRHALEQAALGKRVALICSGDAGIYAMGALVFELLGRGDGDGGVSADARRAEIVSVPGVSALQASAARIGAPLGHDFCTISLSDLLTPWEVIERRIKAAAEGDFVISFYNPVSKRRRTQLATAKQILLNHRPPDTPVIIASNLGRPTEAITVTTLAALDIDAVDMLTLVQVGSSESLVWRDGSGKDWVYTPRGYAAKLETPGGSYAAKLEALEAGSAANLETARREQPKDIAS